jgi:hypothetical protein
VGKAKGGSSAVKIAESVDLGSGQVSPNVHDRR